MRKTRGKEGKSKVVNRSDYLLDLVSEERSSISESIGLISELVKKYNLDEKEIVEVIRNKDKFLCLPVGLFRCSLGPLEAVIRYMKDVLNYKIPKIAELLRRDKTTIWTSYRNSLAKGDFIVDVEMDKVDFKSLKLKHEELIIPVSVFADRRLSILESVCLYLKEEFGISYHNLGVILERNERTIWTCVNRGEKKLND